MPRSINPWKVSGMRTICEMHREIYRELKKRNPNDPLLATVNEAFVVGKNEQQAPAIQVRL